MVLLLIFNNVIGFVIIIGIVWMLYLIHSKKDIDTFLKYFIIIIILLVFFSFIEFMILDHFNELYLLIIFYIEIIGILFYITLIYLFYHRISQSDYNFILYISLMVLIVQITITGFFNGIWTGLLVLSLIFPLIFYIYMSRDIENIKMALSIVIPLYLIFAFYFKEYLISIYTLIIIGPIIIGCDESIRKRIKHIYYTNRIKIRQLINENFTYFKSIGNKKVCFYQARVSINKLAYVEELDPRQPFQKLNQTWLQKYFDEVKVYGIEMVCRNNFSINFLIKAPTKKEAEQNGQALLQRLTSMYRGANGQIEIIPITKNELYTCNQDKYIEIKPPEPPFIERFTLLKDFCNLYGRTKHEIRLSILWEKAREKDINFIRDKVEIMESKDELEKSSFYRMWQGDLFKIKFLVSYKINNCLKEQNEYEIRNLEGMVKGLGLSSRSLKEYALQKKRSIGCHTDILKGNRYGGRLITPNCLDFDITIDLPIEKTFILEQPSQKPLDITEIKEDDIMIGNFILDGVLKKTEAHISINDLAKSAIFIGGSGTGKTNLMCYILNEIKKKSKIGAIYIVLAKGNQESIYPVDYCLKYGSNELNIPYYLLNFRSGKYREEVSEILAGSIGLKNVVVENLINTLDIFIDDGDNPPLSVEGLFQSLLKYFEHYPYHVRFQTNITNAIKNRVKQLYSKPTLIETLKPKLNPPNWFIDVSSGKHVMIDLSMCKKREKRLLTMLILQIVRTLTPDKETNKLQMIISMDEIHQIGLKPEGHNVDDDEFIARESLRKILEDMIKEFRSRGVSFAFADQSAENLFDDIAKQPSLKFLFRQDLNSADIYTKDLKEQKLLTRLEDRHVFVLNGVQGQAFMIKTADYTTPNVKIDFRSNSEINESFEKRIC